MDKPEHRIYGYRWVNLLLFALLSFAMAFSIMGPAVLVGSVAGEWSVSFSAASLALVVLGGLFMGVMGLPAGIASNKWGYKLPLMLGATVATAGALLRSTATSWGLFVLYNGIAGLGAGATLSGVGTLVRKWFPLQEIGQANGLSMLAMPMGAAVGMGVAFPLIDALGWSGMWLVLGIIYAVATLLGWVLLRETPGLPSSPEPPQMPQASAGFIHELKQVMNRTNILLQFVVVAVIGLVSMAPALLPVAFAAQNVPAGTSGLVVALFNLAGVPAMALVPGWAFRKGLSKLTMAASMLIAGLGFIAMFYMPLSGGMVWTATVLALIAGAALGAATPVAISIAMTQPGVTPGNVGTLSGVTMSIMGLGRLVLPPIVGWLVDNVGTAAGAWVLTLVLLVAGAVVAIWIAEPKPQSPAGPATTDQATGAPRAQPS